MTEPRHQQLTSAGIAGLSLILFGILINRPGALFQGAAFVPLVLLIAVILRSLKAETSLKDLLALKLPRRNPAVILTLSVFLGAFLALLCRWQFLMPLLPASLTLFAPVAALIGATEEIVVRGYLQGRLRVLGPLSALLIAAAAHTAYKCALFLPPAPQPADFLFLAFWTFVGGMLFGDLRETTRSLWPPLLAHAAFDIVLYGGLAQAPWWVW
jgi:membrane protease YdiL (CAAX protease family)